MSLERQPYAKSRAWIRAQDAQDEIAANREAARERAADSATSEEWERYKNRAASRRKRLWLAEHEPDEGSRIFSGSEPREESKW